MMIEKQTKAGHSLRRTVKVCRIYAIVAFLVKNKIKKHLINMSCKADSDDILLFAILNSLTKPITVQLSYSHIV